jgi:SHS2 domain-containing protein
MKEWSTYEHPSDQGLTAEADSFPELLEALGEALTAQLCVAGVIEPRQEQALEASADDAGALVVEFLSELLHRFAIGHFLAARIEVESVRGHAVIARLWGECFDPTRHEAGSEVKAVTYHQLEVGQREGRWLARVLLDL